MTDSFDLLLVRLRTAVRPAAAAAALAALLVFLAGASVPAAAQGANARQAMDRCAATVLQRLARRRAPESQVGMAVVTQCDRQLRATLEASIRSGEAGGCTVDSCIDMARAQAAEPARQSYRQHLRR